MKNICTLVALIGCFTFLASSSVSAQDLIGNYTDCDIVVKVGYGPVGSCTVTGYASATIPANSNMNVGIPAGTEIILAKGKYAFGPFCAFYVGQSCSPYSNTDNVSCSGNCGDYTAFLNPAIGIKIYN